MRHCLITCLMLLAACGPDARPILAPPPISADLLIQQPGWTGPTPRLDGQFALAAAAEKHGREMCNGQLGTIRDTLSAVYPAP